MAVTYDGLMSLKSEGDVFTYTDRETMLYALGVGFGRDPMNEAELPFVYENGLKTVPTLATVISGWIASSKSRSYIRPDFSLTCFTRSLLSTSIFDVIALYRAKINFCSAWES